MRHETQDVKFALAGQVFRMIVLNAHGKVVVIYLESTYTGTTTAARGKTTELFFATLLPAAQKMLAAISFP
jgi:hypothetical protein